MQAAEDAVLSVYDSAPDSAPGQPRQLLGTLRIAIATVRTLRHLEGTFRVTAFICHRTHVAHRRSLLIMPRAAGDISER